jgi:hypothetical protein
MADTKAGGITIDVKADFAQFTSGIEKVNQSIKTFGDQAKTHFDAFAEVTKTAETALAGFGAAISVDRFASFVKGVADAAVQIGNMSTELGITTTQYQELMAAAAGANVNQETLRGGFEKLTRSIGEAASGNKALQESFKELNISFLDAQGNIRPTSEVMSEFANAMAGIPDIAERTRYETDLLGRGAQTLDPLFRQGAAALDAFGASAEEDGRVMREDTVAAFKELYDAEDRFQTHIVAMAANIISVVVPALTTLVGAIDAVVSAYNRMTAAENEGATSAALATLGQQLKMFEGQAERIRDQVAHGFLNADVAAAQLQALGVQIDRVKAKIASFVMTDRETGDRGGFTTPHIVVPGSADFTAIDKAAAASAASDAAKAQAEAQKQADAIAKVVEQLQFENEQIGLSSEAQKLNTSLRQAGVEITSAEGAQIAAEVHVGAERTKQLADENKLKQEAKALTESLLTPQEKFNADLDELNKLMDRHLISQETYNRSLANMAASLQNADPAVKEAIETQKELASAVEDAAGSLLTDLGRAFTDSGNAADRWKNFLSHAIQDVMSAFDSLLKKLVGTGVESLLGNLGGATLGSILGVGGGSAASGAIGGSLPFMAAGGHMGIGDWAVVGEAGPEIVYADTPGNVLSAERTRGIFGGNGNGGGNVAYIDARGADAAAVARLEAALSAMNYSFEHRAIAAVNNERKRGGAFAASFRR